MDRTITQPGQIPLSSDMLRTNRNVMVGFGKLIEAVFGSSTLLHGLACTPTAPASLDVVVAPGQVLSLQNVDATAYGSIAADIIHQIVKQGLILDATTLHCAAPATAGYSIAYLVQVAFSESDTDSTLRTYYNSLTPSVPWTGVNNSNVPDATTRKAAALVQVKAGVAAATGSQTPPAPDAGFIGAYVVTVANGQTAINAGNITVFGGAPFLTETLQAKLSQSTADALYLSRAGGPVTGPITLPSDPTAALHAATKQYVDGIASGIQIKASVAVASTANLALTGEQTIDGVLTSGTRILVKNQTAPAQNGIYVTAAGAWSRATDMDAWSEVPGAMVLVTGGGQAGASFLCSSAAGGTLNTTAIVFQTFANAATYQAANAFLSGLAGLSSAGLLIRKSDGSAVTRNIAAGAGIAVTNGDGAAGDPTVAIDKATAAQFRAGTANKVLDAATPWAAAASVDLVDGNTITFDMQAAINGKLALGPLTGLRTLASPTNIRDGQSGKIEIKQDSVGGRAMSFGAAWKPVGGTVPLLSTAPNARDVLHYCGLSDGTVEFQLNKGL